MSKVSCTLCIISLLLFLTLSYNYAVAARPMATFRDITPMEDHHHDVVNIINHGEEIQKKKMDADKDEGGEERVRCEGLGEDECMMRRTLEAHLDYIYTQSRQKQP